jgi:hypothetical protein
MTVTEVSVNGGMTDGVKNLKSNALIAKHHNANG